MAAAEESVPQPDVGKHRLREMATKRCRFASHQAIPLAPNDGWAEPPRCSSSPLSLGGGIETAQPRHRALKLRSRADTVLDGRRAARCGGNSLSISAVRAVFFPQKQPEPAPIWALPARQLVNLRVEGLDARESQRDQGGQRGQQQAEAAEKKIL